MFGGDKSSKLKIETYEDLFNAIKGERGDPGAPGVGIISINLLEESEYDKKLVIRLTDNKQLVFDLPKGIPGQNGNTPEIDYNKIISEVTGKAVEQVTSKLPEVPTAEAVALKLKELGLVKDGVSPIIDYERIIGAIDVPKPIVVKPPSIEEIATYVKESGLVKDGTTPVIDIEAIKQAVIAEVKPTYDIGAITQILYNKMMSNIQIPKAPTLEEILPALIKACKANDITIKGEPGKDAPLSTWVDIQDCVTIVAGKSKESVSMTTLDNKRYMVIVVGGASAIDPSVVIWNNFNKTFIVDAHKNTVNSKIVFDEKSHSDLNLNIELVPNGFGLFYNNPTGAEMQIKLKVEVYAT
jgi:hypothetical protein